MFGWNAFGTHILEIDSKCVQCIYCIINNFTARYFDPKIVYAIHGYNKLTEKLNMYLVIFVEECFFFFFFFFHEFFYFNSSFIPILKKSC